MGIVVKVQAIDYDPIWIGGIDPGVRGATVFVRQADLETIVIRHTSIGKNGAYFDAHDYSIKMPYFIYDYATPVYIESPLVLSGQAGMTKVGINWGRITGALQCMGIPVYEVSPVTWKKRVIPKALRHLGKDASILIAEHLGFKVPTLYPNGERKDHNIAEAFLIACCGVPGIGDWAIESIQELVESGRYPKGE